nr:hypothetical protein Iba_chr07dCG3150 [Ipomoea batatas]
MKFTSSSYVSVKIDGESRVLCNERSGRAESEATEVFILYIVLKNHRFPPPAAAAAPGVLQRRLQSPLGELASLGGVPVVLDRVFRPAGDLFRDLRPPVSQLLMHFHQQPLFFLTPRFLLQKIVKPKSGEKVKDPTVAKVVVPPFSALFSGTADNLGGDHTPSPISVLVHQPNQKPSQMSNDFVYHLPILFFSPLALDEDDSIRGAAFIHCIHKASGVLAKTLHLSTALDEELLKGETAGASIWRISFSVNSRYVDLLEGFAAAAAGGGFSVDTAYKLGFRLCESGLWYLYYIGLMVMSNIVDLSLGFDTGIHQEPVSQDSFLTMRMAQRLILCR